MKLDKTTQAMRDLHEATSGQVKVKIVADRTFFHETRYEVQIHVGTANPIRTPGLSWNQAQDFARSEAYRLLPAATVLVRAAT